MNVLCITIGSHGDVHPFVGIAVELARRGHVVTLATNDYFRPLAEKAGVDFEPLGSAEWFIQGIANPDIWHRYRGTKSIFRWGVSPLVKPVYELIARLRPDVVVASSLALGARVAEDKLGVPVVTIHLSPSVFRSSISPPTLPGLLMPAWLPMKVKRSMWAGGDRYVIDPIIAPPVNALRAEVGLEKVSSILADWWHAPERVIGMFPDWYAPPPADWPKQTVLTGFGLYDEGAFTPLEPKLNEWLNAGDAPIAFTPGSAMTHGKRFFATAAEACVRLKRRGLLLTRHAEQLPTALPPGVRHVPYAPFTSLLPRCAAMVHHGGIGTTSQALRAGIPQLIQPMSHDQPDNAVRLQRLGVGTSLRPTFFRPAAVARRLRGLLDSSSVATACAAAKSKFPDAGCGVEKTCDEVEAFIRQRATR